MISTFLPEYPWQKVASDLFHFIGKDFLIIVDFFFQVSRVLKLHSTNSATVIQAPEKPEFQTDTGMNSPGQATLVSPSQPITSRTRSRTGGNLHPQIIFTILQVNESRCHSWEGKMWKKL